MPAHAVTPQEICICLSHFWNHTECLYSIIKMAASSGNLRPGVQRAPGSSSFNELQACSNHGPTILVLAAPKKGKGLNQPSSPF